MTSPSKLSSKLIKWIANALSGPKHLTQSITAATFATAEFMLSLVGVYVQDISRIKETIVRKLEAETSKAMSEAIEASNKATRSKRSAAITKAEVLAEIEHKKAQTEKLLAEADSAREDSTAKIIKAHAEADALQQDAETRRFLVMSGSFLKENESKKETTRNALLQAMKQFTSEGGNIYVDKEHFEEMLKSGLPAKHVPEEHDSK